MFVVFGFYKFKRIKYLKKNIVILQNYYDGVIDLVKKDGLIIVDNVLWHGEVADENNNDKLTNIIRDFNKYVKNDKKTEQVIIPLGDGLTVCRKL